MTIDYCPTISVQIMLDVLPIKLGGELIYPKLPKTKKTQCYQTFSGAVLYIKAGENFEFGER